MVSQLPWAQKPIFWVFGWDIFQFFVKFWRRKLKPFAGKVRQSAQNFLNQNLVIGSFVENAFTAIWGQKWMLWTFENCIFQFFADFLSYEVKTVFWESKTIQRKLFPSSLLRSILENAFQSWFDLSRQSIIVFLNILNVLNIFIWIFNLS